MNAVMYIPMQNCLMGACSILRNPRIGDDLFNLREDNSTSGGPRRNGRL